MLVLLREHALLASMLVFNEKKRIERGVQILISS
jgi:hypothetical protein